MFGFRKKKPASAPPVTLTDRTTAFKQRLDDVMQMHDPAARYAASLHLNKNIDDCLKGLQSAFDDRENKRMAGTLMGISMGIPAGAIGAAALGAPYLLLIIVPAALGTGIYASHRHQKELAAFQAEIKQNLTTLNDIRRHLQNDRDAIATQHLHKLAASRHRPFLARDCPKLREAFKTIAPSKTETPPKPDSYGNSRYRPPRP